MDCGDPVQRSLSAKYADGSGLEIELLYALFCFQNALHSALRELSVVRA